MRRAFGPVQAVVDATISVPPGAIVGLVGPNGAGKTTLMLMLAGLLRPDAGAIAVAGLDVLTGDPLARARVGWMPDALGSWDSLTCAEFLTTMGRAYGVPKAEAANRAFTLLGDVHLSEYAASPLRVLSRGQKQRLSFARSLLAQPDVLILDEPASGLDPRSRIELRSQLRDLASSGTAILVSSHILSELEEMVDEAVFMSKGRTVGQAADDLLAAAKRSYRVVSLDGPALAGALTEAKARWKPGAVTTEATVECASDKAAAALLATLVGAGVRVSAFAPVASALEEAYLAMDEERR